MTSLSPSPENAPQIFSSASCFASLSPAQQDQLLAGHSDRELAEALFDWSAWARANQLPPAGAWRVWLLLAGRGFGKTRCGAEWVRLQVESGRCGRIALVAPTSADARDVMVEGESGVLAVCPPWNRPQYQPSNRRLVWPNGAMATTYSADEPERLRGPQHDAAWADELAAWRYPEAWDQLMFGLRLGGDPRCVVTTTPKPIAIVRDLLRRAEADPTDVRITRGSTFENRDNLAEAFMSQVVARYQGTRLGQQELFAEVLDQADAALFRREWFDQHRRTEVPALQRIVVAIDPAATGTAASDETGIVVSALGADGRGYVLADRSGRYSPDQWGREAVRLFAQHRANYIVAEKNNGGDMVTHTIRTAVQAMHAAGELPSDAVPVRTVWASQGKVARAEPVSALYEQGRVSHVGTFAALEDQCCTWEPGGGQRSPDRLDALVWGLSELMVKPPVAAGTLKTTGW